MLLRHRRVYALQQSTDSTSPLHSVSCQSVGIFHIHIKKMTVFSHVVKPPFLWSSNRSSPLNPSIHHDVWDERGLHASDMSEIWESLGTYMYGSPHLVTPSSNLADVCVPASVSASDPCYIQRRTVTQTRAISGSILSSSMSLRCTTGPAVPVYCRAWSWWRLQ